MACCIQGFLNEVNTASKFSINYSSKQSIAVTSHFLLINIINNEINGKSSVNILLNACFHAPKQKEGHRGLVSK